MNERVTVDDLWFAVEWLRAYDGPDGSPNNDAARHVAAWIEREALRRTRRAKDLAAWVEREARQRARASA